MFEKLKKLKVNIGLKSAVLAGVCAALIVIDLLTKIYEERYNWSFKVIPGFIEVEGGAVHRNPGCAFSFLADASWGQGFLITTTFILLFALVAIYVFLPERFLILKISLSMIIAGAIGNLVDRIAFLQVRDFVGVNMFGNMVYCNFADFWITFGTALAITDIAFLNEWAIVPLTKKAKEAQAKREENKSAEKAEDVLLDGAGTATPSETDANDDE